MPTGHILLFMGALFVMFIGLAGIVLPILPGIPLIFAAAFLFALITDYTYIGWSAIGIFAALTGVGLILDWLSTAYGVKKMGGSWMGMLGAVIGMLAGLFTAGFAGLIIGSFIGAFVLEMAAGKNQQQAFRAGIGGFIGFIAGGFLKFVIGTIIIGTFVRKALF